MKSVSASFDDPRLLAAVQEYQAELDAGRRPDRQAFLARHADIAAELSACLDGLEFVHGAAPGLHGPADVPDTATLLGDFRLLREIGRGGMGVVYEAEQISLGRLVALKVLPFAAALDDRRLQRFKTEAHAAAQLHHTNIVPVYFVGCERGVHFYAMQLIDGQPLSAVIDDLRRPGTGSTDQSEPTARSRLSEQAGRASFYRTAASLALQAAEALDHAHERGVIHRDIKPANLLLDGQGNLWVTDFGLAQFHADGQLTQTGDLLGTVRYMSPEQAAGHRDELDHRTDLYSLGASLYELLTRRPIFEGKSTPDVLQKILHDAPRPPRAHDRSIPVELETIVLKLVNKHPGDRYGSARDLADDLDRFLDEKPILARRPTLVERARKWCRRHPSLLAAGCLLSLVAVVGLLVHLWLMAGETNRANVAKENAEARAREAEQSFRQARAAVDELIRVSQEELADNPRLHSVRKRLLEVALDYYQDFLDRRPKAADREDLAAAQDRVREMLGELAALQGLHDSLLLAMPPVQDELKLSAQQRRALNEGIREWERRRDDDFRAGRDRTPQERRRRFTDLARSQEQSLSAILTAAQRGRLAQVALQMQGPRALSDSAVAPALGLTAQQRQRLREIEAAAFAPGRGPGFPGPPPRPDPRQMLDRMLAELTPEQRTRWRELTGEPLSFRTPMRGPPGPPPPPPR